MTFDEFDALILRDFPQLSETQRGQFRSMEALYADWNSKVNVISRKDIDNLYEHHVLHSLAIAKYLSLNARQCHIGPEGRCGVGDGGRGLAASSPAMEAAHADDGGPSPYLCPATGPSPTTSPCSVTGPGPSAGPGHDSGLGVTSPTPAGFAKGEVVLDLGTGGGFPGIPLAVLYPDVHFVLCDSIGKKVKVAGTIAEALSLGNVETVNARAEALGTKFDWVVSRAVASLCDFYPWVRGSFRHSVLYLKGGDVEAETAELTRRFRLRKGQVRTWKIASWMEREWFDGKSVVEIR